MSKPKPLPRYVRTAFELSAALERYKKVRRTWPSDEDMCHARAVLVEAAEAHVYELLTAHGLEPRTEERKEAG